MRFYLRPISQELPEQWHSREGPELLPGDKRLVSEVVTAEQRVVMVIPLAPGMVDIGVFVADRASEDAPGADWLQAANFSAAPSPEEVAAVAMAVGGRGAMHFPAPREAEHVISHDACTALIAQVDRAWADECTESLCAHRNVTAGGSHFNALEHSVQSGSRPDDFKQLLTPAALAAAIGAEASAAITALLDSLADGDSGPPDAITVRRTVGTGRWIGFHTDRAAASVQVRGRTTP